MDDVGPLYEWRAPENGDKRAIYRMRDENECILVDSDWNGYIITECNGVRRWYRATDSFKRTKTRD